MNAEKKLKLACSLYEMAYRLKFGALKAANPKLPPHEIHKMVRELFDQAAKRG